MPSKAVFTEELRIADLHLMKQDPVLRPHIRRHSPCRLQPSRRHFETLVVGIVSQQLSTSAARTILGRFRQLFENSRFPTAEQILETSPEQLRGVGLSGQKASYVKDLAARTADGSLQLNRLSRMDDDKVIEMLVAVKGIGVWTAHMFLMFSLGRLNVLPVGDLGIRKAIEKAYGLASLPTGPEIERLAEERRWHPYCSVASWYLWRSLEL